MLGPLAFNQAMRDMGAIAGSELAPDQDQPVLPSERVIYRGVQHEHKTDLYAVWLTQRAQGYFRSLTEPAKSQVDQLFANEILNDLINIPLEYPLARVNNRFVTTDLTKQT